MDVVKLFYIYNSEPIGNKLRCAVVQCQGYLGKRILHKLAIREHLAWTN